VVIGLVALGMLVGAVGCASYSRHGTGPSGLLRTDDGSAQQGFESAAILLVVAAFVLVFAASVLPLAHSKRWWLAAALGVVSVAAVAFTGLVVFFTLIHVTPD
jgi:hypothetical protein